MPVRCDLVALSKERKSDGTRELGSLQAAIEKLVNNLDRVKDESIERAFQQISNEFSAAFKRLLAVTTASPSGRETTVGQNNDNAQYTSVEKYTESEY